MRIRSPRVLIFCLLCLAWPLPSMADMVVIVHPDNPLQSMTPKEVSDLYLGRTRSFGNGAQASWVPATVYEYPAFGQIRERFFRSLNGMALNQLNAYWARLRFSGEVLPPRELADSTAMQVAVSRDSSAIGYVDANLLSSAVKVVLRLKE